MKIYIALASFALMNGVEAAKWNKVNKPENFNPVAKAKMNSLFLDLPLAANLQDDRLGWSETYWPSSRGGIAYRWNHPNPEPFKYKLLTKEELKSLTPDRLGELSPAELYDIAMGDYNYTLTKKVLKEFSPKNLWWEGICHGWSLAASNYPEPAKTVVKNRDGINVPFGSSDVKGLLAMHDAYNSQGFYVRVGDRCKVNGKVPGEALPADGVVKTPTKRESNKAECSDVNAGAFHIVLSSMIGLNSQGFVADVDRYSDVWNQPITGYKSTVVGDVAVTSADSKNGVDRKIQIKTTLVYGEELVFYSLEHVKKGTLGFVSKEPVTGTPAQTFSERKLEYIVELNRSGNIIGGEWISESRPDMLWLKTRYSQFLNGKMPLAGLNTIYKPVTR
jgi:hypothetical protein